MFFLTRLDQYYKLFSEKPFKHQIHPRGGKYRLRTSIFVFSFWFFYEVVDHLFPGFGSWLSSQIFLWRINWRRCWWLFVSGFSPASFKWKPFRWCSWSSVFVSIPIGEFHTIFQQSQTIFLRWRMEPPRLQWSDEIW